jgi:EAL domain-containing protein (putative c-di-GMP-specific phosphodiesterase class I)
MSSAVLENYLARLPHQHASAFPLWTDETGQACARYFDWTLNSVFQPIRSLQFGHILGFEAFARSYAHDMGLSVWQLLDGAASDDESVALDRLCRMLHAINFFRQRHDGDAKLFLSVHARLLTALEGNHGLVFSQVLDALELRPHRVVLQLPSVPQTLHAVLLHVVQSYRSHGFGIALNAESAAEAMKLIGEIRPDIIKLDSAKTADPASLLPLLNKALTLGVEVVFKRLETAQAFQTLRNFGEMNRQRIYAQGSLWELPHPDVYGGHSGKHSAEQFLMPARRHAA